MIPWRFANDRTNCAGYVPWYLKGTISLSASYPQVNEYLEMGGLSVQLGSVNKFGRIPVDQATEETANREILMSASICKQIECQARLCPANSLLCQEHFTNIKKSVFMGKIFNWSNNETYFQES